MCLWLCGNHLDTSPVPFKSVDGIFKEKLKDKYAFSRAESVYTSSIVVKLFKFIHKLKNNNK